MKYEDNEYTFNDYPGGATEQLKQTPIYIALEAVKKRGIKLVHCDGRPTVYKSDPKRLKRNKR